MEDRCDHIGWFGRTIRRDRSDWVAGTYHAAPLDPRSSKSDREATWPVIPAPRRVDLGRSTKLGDVANQGISEHASLEEIFDQGRVALVVHRGDDVLHPLDRRKGLAAVDVPSDLVEDGQEGVDGDEPNAGLDESTRQQAALSEAVHAIAIADGLGFGRKVERFAGLGAGHQSVSRSEVLVHHLGRLASFKPRYRCIDDISQTLAAIDPGRADRIRGEQVGDFEVRLARVGHQSKRIVSFAQKAASLAIGQVSAPTAHGFREDHMGGQVRASSEQEPRDASSMGCIDPTLELPTGLHDLPPGIVHRRAAMETGPNEREFVGDLRMLRKNLRKEHSGSFRRDGLERTSNLQRRIGLDIERVDMARRAEVENHDRRTIRFGRIDPFGIRSG